MLTKHAEICERGREMENEIREMYMTAAKN